MAKRDEKAPLKRGIFVNGLEYFHEGKLNQAKNDLRELSDGGDPENEEHILCAYLRLGGLVMKNTEDQPIEAGKEIPTSSWKKRAEELKISFRKIDKLDREYKNQR